MIEFGPYILLAVLAVVVIIITSLQARSAKKTLEHAEERLSSLEQKFENIQNVLREEARKAGEEKDLKISQLCAEFRAALDTRAESFDKKLQESEASQKAQLDQVIEKVAALLKSSIKRPEQKQETQPEVKPLRESPVHEKAKRLARLIVSDIALYNKAAVEEGVRNNSFAEVMAHDIQEARALYAQRVPEEIRKSSSYLDEAFSELIRRKKQELNIS